MAELDGPRVCPEVGRAAQQLVVLCHGLGADGQNVIGLAAAWSEALPHAVFVAPTAPSCYDQDPGGGGRQWFSVADRSPLAMEAGARAAAAVLGAFVDGECAHRGVPTEQCALVGFSQGAMLVLYAGLRRRVAPRCILAFSGALLGAVPLPAEAKNRCPTLLVHGEADDVVPAARSREAERILRAAGVPVEGHYIAGLGHGIDEAGIGYGERTLRHAFADAK